MGQIGADVQELTSLGNTFTRQRATIEQLMTTVDGAVNSTTWIGPARERFVEEWNGSFKRALNQLNEAFDVAGDGCVRRAQQLEQLMGAG